MSIIQTVKFRCKPDTDAAAFEATNARLQREAPHLYQGMERREATCSAEGDWMVVVRWKDAESAKQPPPAAIADLSKQLASMMDTSTLNVAFYAIKSE